MIGIGLNIGNRVIVSGTGIDPDALAFFARVTAAGGTLTATEQTATNSLVVQMKADGIWTSMKAIYPMVGASAAACAQNLKSSSFTGSFTSGWTFASTGVTPNGTSAFMDTGLNANSILSVNNSHLSYYSRTNSLIGDRTSMGANNNGLNEITLWIYHQALSKQLNIQYTYPTEANAATITDTRGFAIGSRTNSTSNKLYFNNTLLDTNTTITTKLIPSLNIYIGAQNANGSAAAYENKQCAFSSIGDGLTNTQASNFYTAVQTFNQTLNRQVGAQIVSDADAQAYVNRVYTAGGTLTNTEANAVNQLTIDMKAANVWTPMKAIYPMVGASAAACAQNLKSSSFTGSFTSGFTFASTGVTGNGISAFMNTNFLLGSSNNFDFNNFHLTHYSRTDSLTGVQVDMGAGNVTGYNNFYQAIGGSYGGTLMSKQLDVATTNSLGFLIKTATSTTNAKLYKNGNLTLTNTSTQTATADINLNCSIFAQNNAQCSSRQCAFSSIGDGLTDIQASNFYTAVQTFQTTLSRQVI